MEGSTIELVQFRLKPGMDVAAFLTAAEETQAVIAQLPGYLRRELLQNDTGLWIDLVHWRSKADALAAAEMFSTVPAFALFAMMIDEAQMTMLHLSQVRSFSP